MMPLTEELKNLIDRLNQAEVVQSTEKTIQIDSDSRRRIEKLAARNITTAEDLIKVLERALTVDLNGIAVEINPQLLARLKSRAIAVEFDQFIKGLVIRLLEEYAGLR